MARTEKPKLAVPLSDRDARFAIADFEAGRPIDYTTLLTNSEIVGLTNENKKSFIVLKMSYVLADMANPQNPRIALFERVASSHSNKVGDSFLISGGLDGDYTVRSDQKGWIINPYFPLSLKIGAFVGEFELPPTLSPNRDHFDRFGIFVFRRDGERHYAFFVHIAYLNHPNRFPETRGELFPASDDIYQGFFPISSVADELRDSPMTVDRTVLALLRGQTPDFPDIRYSLIKQKTMNDADKKDDKPTISIQNFRGVIGDVNDGTLQFGDYSTVLQDLKSYGVSEADTRELEQLLEEKKRATPEQKATIAKRASGWLMRNAGNIGKLSDTIRGWFELPMG